jgi:apolipoprotein N-acyltransferase
MIINILIVIFSFLAAAYAALGNTTNDQGKLTNKGWAVIIIALALLILGVLKEVKDEKEGKEKDVKITKLQIKIDSMKTALSKIDTNILLEKRMLFDARISMEPYGSVSVPFRLLKGMSIKILKQNCENWC